MLQRFCLATIMAAGMKLWTIPLLNVIYLPLLQNKKNVEGRTERQRKAMDCLKENAPEIFLHDNGAHDSVVKCNKKVKKSGGISLARCLVITITSAPLFPNNRNKRDCRLFLPYIIGPRDFNISYDIY
ncbi:hypothetical protein CRE_30168 [Caenorhabditis remanei]|uniref:Uncharacterized protein n=1 Tax=Caenorhabditis remanei TaxID=31234 RepID=E3NE21_CAERE|nr:hypothetical protein CRE_30168 [Caenorhabditis remanei]